jgi:type 1 glutamine amidotransferase
MTFMRFLSLALASLFAFAGLAAAADAPKRLLLVTHSAGFVHDSVAHAEKVLKEIGPTAGLQVTCFRFTGDPDAKIKVKKKDGDKTVEMETTALADYSEKFRKSTGQAVEREHCGRINATTLKNFDVVLFFTTGNPLTKDEFADLLTWVQAGGAYAGTHCASDTLYGITAYGELVGAYFDGHPWHQKIKLKVEDAKHPGAAGFTDGAEITDEIYQFRDSPYSRQKLHIILSVNNDSIDTKKNGVKRKDLDFAVAWCQEVGKGKSFYTSLGHRKEVWNDKRFQEHLLGGIKWTLGQVPGDATPSAKLTK